MSDDRIRIEGVLAADAMLGYTPGNEPAAVLSFEIHPAKGMPYRVRQMLGTDITVQMLAAAKMVALRRGARVAVYGAGFRAQMDHGISALFVLNVSEVHPLSLPTPTQATHRAANPSQEA